MWHWQGSLESQKSGAQKSQGRKQGGELGHGTPWPSGKGGWATLPAGVGWALYLPLPFLRAQADRLEIIKWKQSLLLRWTQEVNNNVGLKGRGENVKYISRILRVSMKNVMCEIQTLWNLTVKKKGDDGEIRAKQHSSFEIQWTHFPFSTE